MDEFADLYDKYEVLFYELYDDILDKFNKESNLKDKLEKDSYGAIFVKGNEGKEKQLKRLDFEDVKPRIIQIWVNKKDIGQENLDSPEVIKEIINKVTLYYLAREVRKTMTLIA